MVHVAFLSRSNQNLVKMYTAIVSVTFVDWLYMTYCYITKKKDMAYEIYATG